MPWVYVLMPVRVRIDRRADDGVGNVEMPTHETARDMYSAGGAYADIETATTVLLENVPHAPLIKSTGLAPHKPSPNLEKAQKKLDDAVLAVARASQEVADTAEHHQDKTGETYLVGIDEMKELKQAVKEWKAATADFLLAVQKLPK